MSVTVKLLGASDRLLWKPLQLLNEKYQRARYRLKGNAELRQRLRTLEALKGKLSPGIERRCADYARDVLGWEGYATSLRVYSAIAGEFKEGWIPGMYYNQVVVPVTSGDFGKISLVKSYTGHVLGSRCIPDVGRLMQGVFYDQDFGLVRIEDVRQRLFSDNTRVVYKLDNSRKGRNIYIFPYSEFDPYRILRLGNGVFQAFVEQHSTLRKFSPTAAASLRMTTVVDNNGDVSVRSCILRVGRSFDQNTKSSSQIKIPVDPGTGEFAPLAFMHGDRQVAAHPDTGVAFGGGSFPCFTKCVDTVTELHRRVPFVSCIGWDICVDDQDEPKVFEWNGHHNGIAFGEAVQGPCFLGLGWENLWRKAEGPAAVSSGSRTA